MKKTLVGLAVIGIFVLSLGLAGYAYAHSETPPNPDYPNRYGMMGGYGTYGPNGYGQTMMGGRGLGMMGWTGQEGPMHETMIAVFAEALGLSVDEIEARHDAGETLWDIAIAEGLSPEEIQELMFSSHDAALQEAVEAGWLTPEQAEWMDGHMNQMWDGEYSNHCGGGTGYGPAGRWHGMNW